MRTVYLDLETTGLDPDSDEILEIGILADDGEIMLDTLVRPLRHSAWPEAQCINGIAPADVVGAPAFSALWPRIVEILNGAQVVIYNAAFDTGFLRPELAGAGEVVCAMRAFARVFGEWSSDHGSWRWQRLGTAADHVGFVWPGKAHRAIHDCMATRAVWHWINARATAISNPTAPVIQCAHRPER